MKQTTKKLFSITRFFAGKTNHKSAISILSTAGAISLLSTSLSFAAGTYLLKEDFEQGWANHGLKAVGGNKPKVVSGGGGEPNACKGKMVKFSLDYYSDTNNFRNQLQLGQNNKRITLGKEYWVGYAFYLPSKVVNPRGSLDFHGDPDLHLGEGYRNSPVSFKIQSRDPHLFNKTGSVASNPGVMTIRSQWASKPVNTSGFKTLTDGYLRKEIGKLPTDRWVNVVMHFKSSYKPDSYMEMWIDGKQVLNKRPIGTSYNDKIGQYLKFGIYMSEWKTGTGDKVLKPVSAKDSKKLFYVDELRLFEGNLGDKAKSLSAITPKCNGQPNASAPPKSVAPGNNNGVSLQTPVITNLTTN